VNRTILIAASSSCGFQMSITDALPRRCTPAGSRQSASYFPIRRWLLEALQMIFEIRTMIEDRCGG
jgi:hypothetical protein